MSSEFELILNIVIVIGWLAPIALVSGSKRSRGKEKNGWLIATIFLSWLAWLVYIATAKPPKKKK